MINPFTTRRKDARRGPRLVRIAALAAALFLPGATADSQPIIDKAAPRPSSAAASSERSVQGSGLRVWFTNEMVYGRVAMPDGSDAGPAVGMQYLDDDSVEHLYGAGPLIGGKVEGEPRVLAAYNYDGSSSFTVDPRHAPASRFYRTLRPAEQGAVRGCDDDGDGAIDEDPVDGADNDGDWVASTDDVGSDGLIDLLETGCRGGFDSLSNPDPAFDDFLPFRQDLCRSDSLGNHPYQADPYRYTEGNRLPDHGEPNVDEDHGLVSDLDVHNRTPDARRSYPPGSIPFEVDLIQRNYTYSDPWVSSVAPVEFLFVNRGGNAAQDVYVGFFADFDVGPTGKPFYYARNYSCYIESLRTAYTHNPSDPGSTPAGLTILDASGSIDSMRLGFTWTRPPVGPTWVDFPYRVLSGEGIPPLFTGCQPLSELGDTRFFLSVGPYPEFRPGDTLRLTVAFVAGERVYGERGLAENAAKAIILHERGFHPPSPPPPPDLSIEQGERSIRVSWDARSAFQGAPWDAYTPTAGQLPAGHWRRSDPPCDEIEAELPCPEASPCIGAGDTAGARTLEGFRVYRSESADDPPSFSLIRELDLVDEFGYNFGIDSEYVETGLRPGARYWYALTTFNIPETVVRGRLLREGGTAADTISVAGPESDPRRSGYVRLDLKFNASVEPGMVKVVPNPYRANVDYTVVGGGWEGDPTRWTEFDRVLKFIHLPRVCTIRICTLAGEVVKILEFEAPATNPNQGEIDWNLVSDGGFAVASGVYVFVVESDLGRQVGTFVVIR